MNNFIFEKIMENVINHRDVKIVTTNRQRNKLVSEQTYHTTKHIPKNLLIIKIKKTEIKMNKPIYLGLSILYISKTLMYNFWYSYIKPKCEDIAKLCYTDTDSVLFILKWKNFTKTLLMMSNDGSIHLTMMRMIKDHFQ